MKHTNWRAFPIYSHPRLNCAITVATVMHNCVARIEPRQTRRETQQIARLVQHAYEVIAALESSASGGNCHAIAALEKINRAVQLRE